MVTVTAKIPSRLQGELQAALKDRRLSKSEFIRVAIEREIKRSRGRRRRRAIELVRHLAGALKDAPPDLATNPKYMEGYGA